MGCDKADEVSLNNNTTIKEASTEEAVKLLQESGFAQKVDLLDNQNAIIKFNDYNINVNLKDLTAEVVSHSNQLLLKASFKEKQNTYVLDSYTLVGSDIRLPKVEINPEHPNQDFCECFKADMDAMCDGLVGCIASQNMLVMLTVAAHCVYETGTTECPN